VQFYNILDHTFNRNGLWIIYFKPCFTKWFISLQSSWARAKLKQKLPSIFVFTLALVPPALRIRLYGLSLLVWFLQSLKHPGNTPLIDSFWNFKFDYKPNDSYKKWITRHVIDLNHVIDGYILNYMLCQVTIDFTIFSFVPTISFFILSCLYLRSNFWPCLCIFFDIAARFVIMLRL
jgi:hypothetical protein